MIPALIEITKQEPSPFEQEPELCGIYHWHEGRRSMHQHEDRIELNFIFGGNGTHIVGGEICNTKPGDVLIHNSHVLHDESMMLGNQVDAWCIAIKHLKLPGIRENAILPEGMHPRLPCQNVANELGMLYPMIHYYILKDGGKDGGYQIANSLARAIVLIIYQQIQLHAQPVNREENELVEQAEKFIEAHYTENITLSDIAEAVHASESYLSHLFKKNTSYTPQQFILRRRIGKAQCMIIYTPQSITDIAYQTGFTDSGYFSRAFKKIIGMSPNLYRKKWKEASSGSTPSDIHI